MHPRIERLIADARRAGYVATLVDSGTNQHPRGNRPPLHSSVRIEDAVDRRARGGYADFYRNSLMSAETYGTAGVRGYRQHTSIEDFCQALNIPTSHEED